MPNRKCPPDDLAIYLPKIREDHFNTHPQVKKWSSLCALEIRLCSRDKMT